MSLTLGGYKLRLVTLACSAEISCERTCKIFKSGLAFKNLVLGLKSPDLQWSVKQRDGPVFSALAVSLLRSARL